MSDVDVMIRTLAATVMALQQRVDDLEDQVSDPILDTSRAANDGSTWPGYARVSRLRYYDSDFTSDTTGTAITNNLTGSNPKRYIRVRLLPSVLVSWEDGPIPEEFPPAEEWYDITLDHDIHIPWIG